MRKLARLLQLVGLLILPIAMAGNIADPERVGVWPMLTLCGIGLAVFALGWLLQQATHT
jgi:hypothetical protein